jgi:hypothetical protein
VHYDELRLAAIQEHQSLLRSHRAAERAGLAPAHSIRSHIGTSLIRLGRHVAGESIHAMDPVAGFPYQVRRDAHRQAQAE